MALDLWHDLSIYLLGGIKEDLELLDLEFTRLGLYEEEKEADYEEKILYIRGKIADGITTFFINDKYFTRSALDTKRSEKSAKEAETERKREAKKKRKLELDAERLQKRIKRTDRGMKKALPTTRVTRLNGRVEVEPDAHVPEPRQLPSVPMSRHDRHAAPAVPLHEAIEPVARVPQPMSLPTLSRPRRARQATPPVRLHEAVDSVALIPQPARSRHARQAGPASPAPLLVRPPPAAASVAVDSASAYPQVASTLTTDKSNELEEYLTAYTPVPRLNRLRDILGVEETTASGKRGRVVRSDTEYAIHCHAESDEMADWIMKTADGL